jgi:BirA family biotin operon repressor/biotin-[acetyl-CoA-carboxylase] ligase
VLWLDSVDSTNAEGLRRLGAGFSGPAWISTDNQWAGRGRRGRGWDGGQGNLASSLVMVSRRSASEIAQLSFVAAVAVADALCGIVPMERVQLKWPNDVLIEGAKSCGILLESVRLDADRLGLVVGIGVNLNACPDFPGVKATAVARHAAAVPSPMAFAKSLADCFEKRFEQWSSQGFDPISKAWTQMAFGLGDPCQARLMDRVIEGRALGLDVDGALRLQLPDGEIIRISAGEVFFGAVDATGH